MTIPVQAATPLPDVEQAEPSVPGQSPAAEEQAPSEDFAGLGPWLEKPDSAVFTEIDREVKRQEPSAKNRLERHKRNDLWRQGKLFARLKGADKLEDIGQWRVTLPDGLGQMPPVPNKVDDLCNKVTAQVTTDPPVPDAEPQTDSDDHRAAAEFATIFLKVDGDESGTNDQRIFQRAVNFGCTKASTFVHDYVNPVGAGWRPKQLMADPQAVDANNPLVGPEGIPTGDPILRYVTAQGQFTERASEADIQWLPKLCSDLLFPEHVRFLPETADGIENAEGVILLDYAPLSELQAALPDTVGAMADEDLRSLASWKPPRHLDLLPKSIAKTTAASDPSKGASEDGVPPDTLIFFYRGYRVSRPLYPKGAYVMVSGAKGGTILHKQTWSAVVDESEAEECLDLPIAQVKQLDDTDWLDPFGKAIIERFGQIGEGQAALIGATYEVVDRALHPNVFLAATSPVQPKQLALRNDTPIPVVSVKDDAPFYEPPPQIPEGLVQFVLQTLSDGADSASGLQQTAQGVESADSQSGVAKQAVIEQSLVALGPVFQNYIAALRRHWRVKLQLARAFMPQPQRLRYVGPDSAFKEEQWSGTDLRGVKDVSIQKGTGTMMAPSAKTEMVATYQQQLWLSPDEASDIAQAGIAPIVGIQDNPHRNRVRRQIAAWKDGPPEGWQPSQPAIDPMTGQPAIDPATQQPAMQPASWSPFDQRPNDEEPLVAKVRHAELTKLVSDTAYTKWAPEWRALVDEEYQRMAYAAGIQTVRQQAEAQAQAQAQQQQQAMQQQASDQQFKADQADQDRTHEAEQQAQAQQAQAQQMAQQSTTQAMQGQP